MEPVDSFVVLYNALMIEDKDNGIHTLRTLIESGVDVNSCWNVKCKSMPRYASEGLTVLMVAARYGYVNCVHVLLNAGANVNQSDAKGQTALKQSASKGHGECMKLLLEAGADVNQSNVKGQTALMEAARVGHVKCMSLLSEAGVDVDQSNIYGETALTSAACNGHDKCVRLLIEAGVDVNHLTKFGRTALIISASVGSVKCMELLLEAGADVNGVDARGNTAVIYCLNCFDNSDMSKACLKLLINAGADIDVRNKKNLRPIHFALKRWQRTIFLAEYLISENCNLSHASYNTVKSFYVQLKEEDRLDILKLLFACGLPRHLCQTFIVEKETSVRNWIETVASQTITLKSICVFEIRKTLGPGIKSKVTKLNLPNVIQNLILLKGILSLECFD